MTRDTQFEEFAKMLWEELEDKGEFNIDMASRDSDDIVRLIIARRAYDLACHVIQQADPSLDIEDMKYIKKRLVLEIPDMTEWP